MAAINRRTLLTNILPGAAVTVGVVTAGWVITPKIAKAVPLAADKTTGAALDDLVEKAQRRRRWVCWWSRSRGRRVCGWRWV